MGKLTRVSEWSGQRADTGHPRPAEPHPVRYFAFLSYSHRDQALAEWLHDQLESFRVPASLAGRLTETGVVPKRLTPIFRDRRELPASADLGSEIREALAATRCLIVLCSPAAAQSRWTNAEIDAFKRQSPGGCVLAAIVDGEPFASDIPGREQEECLPPALRIHYDRRGRPTAKRAEPLAADLRDDRDGKRLGLLKIVAGMLGLGLDELVQRETLRRQRRLAMLAAASLAGMVVTSGLAVTAIQARDAARDERREAEGLVGFMLGDLRGKLEPVGRLDALDAVGARVLAYYSKQDESDLSDAALSQRSRALSLMGEIASLRGDLGQAMRFYGEAMTGTQEALERAPGDPQRLFDHAQNVFMVGEMARLRGRTDAAETAFRHYQRLAARMVAIEPDNLKWRMEVQYADANLGIVLVEQRRFSEAARQFQQALATIEAVAAVDPKNADYQKSVAVLLAWLADARLAEGRLDEAIAHRQRQLSLLNGPIQRGSGDVEYREKAIPAHQALGRLYATRGDVDRGLPELQRAIAHAEKLIPAEPDNMKWVEFAAAARLANSELLLDAGRREDASAETLAGCRRVQRLMARDRSVVPWRNLLRICLTTRSKLALASGANAEGLALAEEALRLTGEASSGDRIADLYTIAAIRRLIGDAHQRLGDKAAATAAWQAGLAGLPTGVAERPWEMSTRARLLQRLGRGAEATPLTARLDAIGYRQFT